MLEIKDLHVSYGAINAIRGISLTVNDGELVTLIGANGAGKTTTLHTINGLLNAASGEITFDGHDYFLLWHKFGAKYICLEPWCGVQDVAGTSFNIKEKEGIMEIMPGETLSRTHTITAG